MVSPLNGAALSGRRVLMMLIPRDTPRDVYFVAGLAAVGNGVLTVVRGAERIRIDAPLAALSGFDPEMLPHVLRQSAFERLANLRTAIDACVPIFVDAAPAGCLWLQDCFFGLGQSADGRPLLFQGQEPRSEPLPRHSGK